jgi:chorismate synthase
MRFVLAGKLFTVSASPDTVGALVQVVVDGKPNGLLTLYCGV